MDYEKIIELNNITLWDCYLLYEYKHIKTIINDGRVVNLEKEE